MTLLLDCLYGLAVCLGWPFLLYRRLRRGPGSLSLRERLGNLPSRPVSAHCVWIHGVSLGEINAARTIVEELEFLRPQMFLAISSTTQTGLERARVLYGRHTVFRFPLDFSFIIRRVLDRIRPSIIVLMELEAWPNLIAVAVEYDIPVIIANARVTETKSMRRFNRPILRTLAKRMFGKITWVGAQDETYAARFARLGVPAERIEVCGSVKYDAADLSDRIEGQDELAAELGIDPSRPLLVCGSTGPAEESLILDAYERVRLNIPTLQLALIPRKPERFEEVADLIVRRGYECIRRTVGKPPSALKTESGIIFLGDTMGELRKFYALASLVFVGRSLVPLGGSDVMEAAGLAKPVLIGPHTDNFAQAADLLISNGGAWRVDSSAALATAIETLQGDRARLAAMGQAARATIESQRGATALTVARILSHGQLD